MKKTSLLAASLAVSATSVLAGGMDRSGQSIAPIFENGTYAELSYGSVDPTVSGVFAGVLSSGDMAKTYGMLGAAYKRDLTDQLSMALIIDSPFGADVDYGSADAGYPFLGATASVETTAITALLRYKFDDRLSVHGGIRNLTSRGEVSLPALPGTAPAYEMSTTKENDWSYLVGAAYEIPDIALRAALTYSSETTIDFETTENFAPGTTNPMQVIMPKSVRFDFQTGIAADTLLMANVRWAEWSKTTIAPANYAPLVEYDDDVMTYSIGVGRRFSDQLSASVSYGYEKAAGGTVGNLGPTDGSQSITVGVKYSINENTALSGGASYVWIGDATTSTIGAAFSDNSALGVGLKLSHSF